MIAVLFAVALFLPLGAALALWLQVVLGHTPRERTVARLVATVQVLQVLAVSGLVAHWLFGQLPEADPMLRWHLGTWYAAGDYHFDAVFALDLPSAVLALLASVLCGLIGQFSVAYLHKDSGFLRFFALLLLFSSALQVLSLAGSIDLLFAGWELVGLASTLLIAFFDTRRAPMRSALWAFATYRVADVGLLFGAALLHHHAHSAEFAHAFGPVHWPLGVVHLPESVATGLAFAFVMAAMGKSALFPASAWLPRAMEGPTPSSALFYGALSIHAGVFLLLRVEPLLEAAPIARVALVVLGLVTAQTAAMAGRVAADAKSALAFASLAQVGLMIAEIGAGLYWVAVAHLAGHALWRSRQLLRSPSWLADAEAQWQAGVHVRHGEFGERLLPAPLRRWLYRAALERFWLEGFWQRVLAQPVLTLARGLLGRSAPDNGHAAPNPWLRPQPGRRALHAMRAGPLLLVLVALTAPTWLARPLLPWLAGIGLVSALYAGLLALAETDLRRLGLTLALGQSGLVAIGLASGDAEGLAGVPVQLIAAGLAVSGWLVIAGAFERRLGTTDVTLLGGLRERAPLLSWLLLFFGLAGVGLPGTLGFVGEDLLVHGVLEHHPWLALGYIVATALLAIAILKAIFAAAFGPMGQVRLPPAPWHADATPAERRWLLALAAPLVVFGLWPAPLVDVAVRWTAPLLRVSAPHHAPDQAQHHVTAEQLVAR